MSIPDWRTSRWKRVQAAAIAAVGYRAIALLGRTLRWHVEGFEHFEGVVASGRQPVMAFWHGGILGATYYFRRRGIVVMTSQNFDGEWIAGIIERFGYVAARGSTSRGALRALTQMRKDMRRGQPAGFTVDGPRGPARRAQPGAVWLASVTGNPILPFHVEAERRWTAGSWDRTQIPMPFSRMALVIGPPIEVPRELEVDGIEARRVELESTLNELARRALTRLNVRSSVAAAGN